MLHSPCASFRRLIRLTDKELLDKIYTIQQEWWEGDIEMNVALSEIRALFYYRDRKKLDSD